LNLYVLQRPTSISKIADNDGVNAVWTRSVTANHQFLSAIHTILNPRATSFSKLVRAVIPLSDNALKVLGVKLPGPTRPGLTSGL